MKTWTTMAYWTGSEWQATTEAGSGRPGWLPPAILRTLPGIEAPANQICVTLSAGRWMACCLAPFASGVMGSAEPGSVAAKEHCSAEAIETVRAMNRILSLDVVQAAIDADWRREYEATEEDRALVAALARGARMGRDGRIQGVEHGRREA